jgi:hypothetical protein
MSGGLLDFAAGEVVDTPHALAPYCAVFRVDDQVLFSWPVNSVEEGQARIREALGFLFRKIVEGRDDAALGFHIQESVFH